MYVKYKTYKEHPDRTYVQIVESKREGNKVRKKTVLSLGRIDNNDAVVRVNKLLKTLLPIATEVQAINPSEDISPLQSKQFGTLIVFKELWSQLGLDQVLRDTFEELKTFYDLEHAVFNLVLNRLIAPSSKRRMTTFQETVYGITKFDLHQYYRAMDYLVDNKDVLEKKIYSKMLEQHKGKITMAFFDTTSLVYYGDDPKDNSELLQHGFSKARRGDLKQIVVGVMMSPDGIPLGHETFAGNESDVNCFDKILTKAVDKYGISRVIFVGDRGMISKKNIKTLENLGQEYIFGYRMRTISKEERAEVFKKADLKSLRNTKLQYKEVDYRGQRLIFCYNEDRAKLDAEHRERLLTKLKEKLKSGNIKSLLDNQNYLRFLDDVEGSVPKLSKKKVKRDEEFDGVFVLTSNAKLSGPQVVEAYKGLWQIEQGFKQLKSELKLGPIHHYTDKRIRAHVMICFLALIMRRLLTKKLKDKFKDKSSYPDSLDELKNYQIVEMKVKEEEMHLTTEIKRKAKMFFDCLKISVPEKVVYQSNPNIQFVGPEIAQ